MKQIGMRIVLFVILCSVQCVYAQVNGSLRTDTVKPGYYIPLDSNVVSCKVGLMPLGGKLETFNMQGNSLSSETITKIGALKKGSVVLYTEITILNGANLQKANAVRYVIGNRNSVPALRDPSRPDTLTGAEIGAIVLAKEVYSFHISYVVDGAMYDYEMTGNGVAPMVKEKLLTLPSGTRVWFESIRTVDGDGAKRLVPSVVYVVK